MAVAVETLLPVSVLEPVTAAPGIGVFPDFAVPRTTNYADGWFAEGVFATAAAVGLEGS